ncbi:MAG: hypothetical protein IPG89_16870 [Bacteroidetes bacterium]|nr:hypothetical protein [Bacteroidota bacterium]
MIKKILTIIVLATSTLSFGQSISGGYKHSLFLCPNGTVKAFGYNSNGQLGLGNYTNKTLPESVSTLSGITAIAAGDYNSLFLKNDGTVWVCGDNAYGQLGTGTTPSQNTPVQVNTLTGITAIAGGQYHSLFLKSDGTVWACGINTYGQLGNGNNTHQKTPVQVNGLSGITAIAAGTNYSLFLKNDGTVWACGSDSYGSLGIGTLTNHNTPVQVNGLSGITAIARGRFHSLFLKNDGTVWACGSNYYGFLGIGTTNPQIIPVRVSSLSGITAIVGGEYHSLFLKNDGTVWACGQNRIGQLGDGTKTDRYTPVQVNSLTGITAIDVWGHHSLFLKNDGTVWACGNNTFGQLGTGNTNSQNTPVNIGVVCTPPAPPAVNMSNMPTSVCLGSDLSVDPNISGSNPVLSMSLDNSISITNPKAITKNKNSVFVLNDNDAIARYNFNGTLVSSLPSLSITGIKAFAVDDSSNVYLHNGDGNIYKCDSTGLLVNTITPLITNSSANQLVYSKPVNSSPFLENLFVVDAQQSSGTLLTGINTYDNNQFTNYNSYPSDSLVISQATSMALDNFHTGKRALIADPVNNTLRTRVLYPDGSGTFDYQENFLVEPSQTAGMALDFIDADTLYNQFLVSSKTTGILGYGADYRNSDGTITSYLDTSLTSLINPTQPVGIVSTSLGSQLQFWIADRGQNKLLRAYFTMYQISPALPAGLKYNTITGKIDGTPTTITSPQTYRVILTTPYGADTTFFSFQVTPTNGVSNTPGTGSSAAQQNDGLMVKYIDFSNCEKLIDIADSLGGTSPGQTTVTQTVYPLVSVIAGDSLIRRATQINADNIDTLKVNATFYYTYQDIQLYKQTTGSTLSNDTIGGTMQIAVLQMHDLPNGGKEPILHSPVTATWSNNQHNWVAIVPLTKFSDFYAGDISTLSSFNCTNSGKDTIVANDFYIWNYPDSLFTSGDYVDTLINHTGCDSIVQLHLTINITTGLK